MLVEKDGRMPCCTADFEDRPAHAVGAGEARHKQGQLSRAKHVIESVEEKPVQPGAVGDPLCCRYESRAGAKSNGVGQSAGEVVWTSDRGGGGLASVFRMARGFQNGNRLPTRTVWFASWTCHCRQGGGSRRTSICSYHVPTTTARVSTPCATTGRREPARFPCIRLMRRNAIGRWTSSMHGDRYSSLNSSIRSWSVSVWTQVDGESSRSGAEWAASLPVCRNASARCGGSTSHPR